MLSDDDLIDQFKKHKSRSMRALSAQYDNTETTWSYYNDADSSYEDQIQFADATGRKRRALVNFQKIPQYVDGVVGFMAQNRRQAKFIARVNDDPARSVYSRNMNAIYSFHRENSNADQLESRQDLQVVVNGYGAIETDLSYLIGNATTLPNGEILKQNIDPMKSFWDPVKTPNIMTARYVGYWEEYDLKDALSLFQGSNEEDFEPSSATDEEDSSEYVYNPWGGLYDRIRESNSPEWSSKSEDLVKVYNYQWYEYETFYKCDNPLFSVNDPMTALYMKMRMDLIAADLKSYQPDGIDAGDLFDFDPTLETLTFDAATKSKLVKEFGDLIDPTPFTRKCYYTAVISGKHVFNKFKSISQRNFSIQFKTGNYNERGKYWIGMVNAMIEPQKFFNKAITETIFTIAAASKGGVYIEEGATDDVADFEAKYAKTDAVIELNAGGIAKILPKAQPVVGTGYDAIAQLADSTLASNGVDPSFLGQSNDNESGILYKRRIRQTISKIWWIADAATLYQKEEARLMLDLMPVWVKNNKGETIRVTGQDGSDQFLVLSQDKFAAAYDVTIQEAPTTPEENNEISAMIMQLAQAAAASNPAAAGQLAYEGIDMLPIDGDKKAALRAILVPDQSGQQAQQQQQAQTAQQEAALAAAHTQAQINKANSESALNAEKLKETQAATSLKMADTYMRAEQAQKENIETRVIQQHARTANINI